MFGVIIIKQGYIFKRKQQDTFIRLVIKINELFLQSESDLVSFQTLQVVFKLFIRGKGWGVGVCGCVIIYGGPVTLKVFV